MPRGGAKTTTWSARPCLPRCPLPYGKPHGKRCVYTLFVHSTPRCRTGTVRYQKHEISVSPRRQPLGATSVEDEHVACGSGLWRAFSTRTGLSLRRPARRANTAANVRAYLMCWLSQSKPSLKPRFSKTEHL